MIVYIASYPRSGNRLTRNVIEHYFDHLAPSVHPAKGQWETNVQNYKIQGLALTPTKDTRIWQVTRKNGITYRIVAGSLHKALSPEFRKEIASIPNETFFLKTHWKPYPRYFQGEFILHIVRHPGASLWSYYNFMHQMRQRAVSVEAVIEGKVGYGSWSKYIESWNQASVSLGNSIVKIKFEQMVHNELSAVEAIQQWTGLEMVEELGTFPNFEYWHKRDPIKYRRGKTDEWKEKLTAKQIKLLNRKHGKTMQQEGYELYQPEQRKNGTLRVNLERLQVEESAANQPGKAQTNMPDENPIWGSAQWQFYRLLRRLKQFYSGGRLILGIGVLVAFSLTFVHPLFAGLGAIIYLVMLGNTLMGIQEQMAQRIDEATLMPSKKPKTNSDTNPTDKERLT